MNVKLKYIIGLLLIFLCFGSCTEKYFPKVISEDGILVVDGRITNLNGPYNVNLFRTVNLESHDSILPEKNAEIIIHSDDGTHEILTEVSPGDYESNPLGIKGKVGKSYWIEITTSDGKIYESSPEKIPTPFQITNIYGEEEEIIIDIDEQQEAVRFYFDLESEETDNNYFIWNYHHSWEWHTISDIPKSDDPAYICYPWGKSNTVNIYNASTLTDKTVKHLPLSLIPEHRVNLLHEYFIKVDIYSISKSCYNFWNNIKKITQLNGNMFDIIPSNVYGNVECCTDESKALGYFQVSSTASSSGTFSDDLYNVDFALIPGECDIIEMVPISFDPNEFHLVKKVKLNGGGEIYLVRRNLCYDCSLKYSPDKPSFWPK